MRSDKIRLVGISSILIGINNTFRMSNRYFCLSLSAILIFLCITPIGAQETSTPQSQDLDKKTESIFSEQFEFLKEIVDSIPPVPPITASAKVGLTIIDQNINPQVDRQDFHFEREEVSAALGIKMQEKGSGILAGTDTSVEFKTKVSSMGGESPPVFSNFFPPWSDDGSNLKIAGIGGVVDVTVYPFKANITTVREPIKVEKSGIEVDVSLGDFAFETVTGSSVAEKGDVRYALSANFSYSATEGVSFRGGAVLAQADPVGNLKENVLKTGYGAEVKLGNSEEGFGASISVGVKAFPISDPNAQPATSMPPVELRAVKVDAPMSYKFKQFTSRGGFSFTQYQWYEEVVPMKDEGIGHELRINLGETLDSPEIGLKSHFDIFVIFPHYKILDGRTTVDPGNRVDDVHGEEPGEIQDRPALAVVKIITKLDAKISDILTISPILTLTNDLNYSEGFKDKRTIVGYELKMEAVF